MSEAFGRRTLKLLAGVVGASLVTFTVMAQTQNDPPGRVGRLAFVDGTVSFHDDEQEGWTKAVVNTPLTTGDAIWTEPNARSEVSIAGTRVRLDGSTELDLTQVDDSMVRLQLAQGRVDVKTTQMDTSQPYEIVTPRGTITLQQQGDYYVEAGSQQDPTRLGVRSGAAQILGLNGQTLAVRPGEVGEVFGDGSSMQLKTVRAAPPAPAASWAARDRQVVYDQQPQYVPAGMTGYEDLNGYGNWVNDGAYGQVWVPRSTPAGWAPYRTGHWSYVKPWGWTWIDEQPWGFAPYHYGRWANSNNRWVWVPPQREQRPVYAPALVAFVGGIELAAQLGNQGRNTGPVGWFPLGPREAYVPPYSTNRDYYQRINRAARIQDRDLDDRWERAQRREAFIAGQNSVLVNQRYATVVPSQAFVRSQPIQRAVLNVPADRIARAAVAPVSAPPAPTASVAAAADARTAAKRQAPDTKEAAGSRTAAEARPKSGDVAVAKTAVADMETLAKPAAAAKETRAAAPGPKIARADARTGTETKATTAENPDGKAAKTATPSLRPRQGAAPPALKEETDKAEPSQARQEQDKQDPRKPAANQSKEAAPAPPKPALASPDPSPAKRDELRRPDQKQDAQKPNESRQDEPKQAAPAPDKPATPQTRQDARQDDDRKQAAPDQQKRNAAPQPKQEEPKQAAPAPQRPAATPQQRKEEPRQAAPQPAPRQEPQRQEAPRQEAPRQAAPQPRAEPQQQRQEQAQPQRPQPQQAQPPRQQPQPQQQQPQRERETRAPQQQQQQNQQIAQPPQQQQQPQRGNNGGGGGNKKDKD